MKKRHFVAVSTFAMLALPLCAAALGISVAPPTLSIETSTRKEGLARFTVSNPSNEVGLFEVYPEEFDEYLFVVPSRFLLEAGEKRSVTVRARRREAAAFRSAIAVETVPLGERASGIGGGVRIPIFVRVTEGASGASFAAAALGLGGGGVGGFAAAAALAGIFWLGYRRRRQVRP